jgi:hypothetical protein
MELIGHDIVLHDGGRQLQVRIGDSSRGVFKRYKLARGVVVKPCDLHRTGPLVDDSAALPAVVARSCRRVEAGNSTPPICPSTPDLVRWRALGWVVGKFCACKLAC